MILCAEELWSDEYQEKEAYPTMLEVSTNGGSQMVISCREVRYRTWEAPLNNDSLGGDSLELWLGFMNSSTRSTAKSLLRGVAWLFFVTAGLAFWFGGGVIHAVDPSTDRILAEIEGMALAVLCAGLGVLAKGAEDRLEAGEEDPDGPKSLGEALRK